MRSLVPFFFLFLLWVSCEEETDVSLLSEDTGLLVVEGVMTNERRNHKVTLSLPYREQNGESQPATGASVFVKEDTTLYVLSEFPAGSGNYYTPDMRAVTGKIYTLIIQYEGREYVAEDSSVPVQPLRGLKYEKNSSGYRITHESVDEDPNYIEYVLNWENSSACIPTTLCNGKIIFYDLKTIDVNEIFKPEKEQFYFPEQTSIVRRKYSVSPAYRAFLRAMLSETEWRGGVFDVDRANVPSNLSEGAVGFFAVCSVVSDSTVVQ